MLPLGSGYGNDGDGYGILRNPHYHQASDRIETPPFSLAFVAA